MSLAPSLVSQLKELADQTNTKTPVSIDRENCVDIIQAIANNTKKKAITKLNDCLISIRLELEKTNDVHAAEFATLIQFIDFNNLGEVRQLRDVLDQIMFDTDVELRMAKWENRYLPFFMQRIAGTEPSKDYKQENPDLFAEKTPKELALENKQRVLRANKTTIESLLRGLAKLQKEVEPLVARAKVKELDEIPTSPRFTKG